MQQEKKRRTSLQPDPGSATDVWVGAWTLPLGRQGLVIVVLGRGTCRTGAAASLPGLRSAAFAAPAAEVSAPCRISDPKPWAQHPCRSEGHERGHTRPRLRATPCVGAFVAFVAGRRLGASSAARSSTHGPSPGAGAGAAGHARLKAVLATASWMATDRAPHQRRAHPEADEVANEVRPLAQPSPLPLCMDAGALSSGGHQCCVAAQHPAVGSGAVDDKVEAPTVLGWDAGSGCVGEPLLCTTWPSAPTASRATRTQAGSTTFARLANKPVREQARAWSPRGSMAPPHPGLGPQRLGQRGRGRRRRRLNAICMACGGMLVAWSHGTAVSHAPACSAA